MLNLKKMKHRTTGEQQHFTVIVHPIPIIVTDEIQFQNSIQKGPTGHYRTKPWTYLI